MSAPEEKKGQTDEAQEDHVHRTEPRHRLLNDADSAPEPWLHGKRSAGGSWLAASLSFSTVAAILFLVWGGIEIMPAAGRIPLTSILIGIHDRQALVNEPIPLGGVLLGLNAEAIHVTGLTEGSRLSAGEKVGASGWQIPARDLAGVLVVPPSSFVGSMRAVIELRSAGNVPVDTQIVRYEWVAKLTELTDREATPRPQSKAQEISQLIPPAGKLNPQRSAQLVKRGVEFIRIGDFAAARLVLRPAAEAGNAEAALLLGATYDPTAVSDLGARGLAPDPNVARAWYQRAMESGSIEASGRIERLTRAPQ